MSSSRGSDRASIFRKTVLWTSVVSLLCTSALVAAANDNRLVTQGRRIYVDGILPDGSPLKAIRFGGASEVTGTEAACINCHRRSGYGSVEGRILVPPVAGAVLFAPGVFAPSGARNGTSAAVSAVERFRARSAYDEKKLMRAMRDGVDPDGAPLQPPMARYRLDAGAVAALAAYLRQMSPKTVPGITGETLHLGTVISPDVSPRQRDALLEVLRAFAATSDSWDIHWQLHVWQLTGAPQDWDAQLAEHYRHQPVFALISGAGKVDWQPVHRFCERNAIACVLPSVELAPDRDGDYYSLYFSSGLDLEARLLAHHLATEAVPPQRLLQVVSDDSGERAASSVRLALSRTGSKIAVAQVNPEEYAAMAPLTAHDAVVWWLRPKQIAELSSAMPEANPAGHIYLSSLLAPPEELAIPEAWKPALRYISFFDTLAARRSQTSLVPWLARHRIAATDLRLRGDAYAACNYFNSAFSALQLQSASGIKGPPTRERLLETLESGMTVFRDDVAPYYWQLSLGPGQRVLVKGGMLLSYDAADAANWIPATARIVP